MKESERLKGVISEKRREIEFLEKEAKEKGEMEERLRLLRFSHNESSKIDDALLGGVAKKVRFTDLISKLGDFAGIEMTYSQSIAFGQYTVADILSLFLERKQITITPKTRRANFLGRRKTKNPKSWLK